MQDLNLQPFYVGFKKYKIYPFDARLCKRYLCTSCKKAYNADFSISGVVEDNIRFTLLERDYSFIIMHCACISDNSYDLELNCYHPDFLLNTNLNDTKWDTLKYFICNKKTKEHLLCYLRKKMNSI
jgi:hypothetical protein